MEILGLLFLLIVIVLLWPTGSSIFRRKKMSKEDEEFMAALRNHKHSGVQTPFSKTGIYVTTPDPDHAPVRRKSTRFPNEEDFVRNDSLTHSIATDGIYDRIASGRVDHCYGSSGSSDHSSGGSGGGGGKGSDD